MAHVHGHRLVKLLAAHADYSFEPVGWNFEQLTALEQAIIGSQVDLDALRRFCERTRKETPNEDV